MVTFGKALTRASVVLVPAALVLGQAGAAWAAKPVKTPTPVLASKPANPSSSRTATFTWAAAANATAYYCTLDGKGSSCSSGVTYTALTDRTHTFSLRATRTDVANAKPASVSYSWAVDATPPAVPTVAALPTPTSSTSASVSWTDADTSITGYTCELDGVSLGACTSPKLLSGLTEQSHTVKVIARDAVGNTSSATRSWVVDHTAPNIPVVTPATTLTKDTSLSVAFSGEDGDSFTCALDDAPAAACTSPAALSSLTEGTHTFTVTPTDAASNVGTPGSATFTVDRTPPAGPSLVTAPPSLTNQTAAAVAFTGTDLTGAGFTCALDGVPATTCSSPWTGTVGQGSHTLVVRTIDAAGNVSDQTDSSQRLSVTWSVDSVAPSTAEFISGPDSPTNVAVPSFDFTDTDATATAFRCTLDTAPPVACTPSSTWPAQVEGMHTFTVEASDDALNYSSGVTWHWTVDTTPPAAPLAVGVGNPAGPVQLGASQHLPSLVFQTGSSDTAGFRLLARRRDRDPVLLGRRPVGDGGRPLRGREGRRPGRQRR